MADDETASPEAADDTLYLHTHYLGRADETSKEKALREKLNDAGSKLEALQRQKTKDIGGRIKRWYDKD